jgi:glutathione S-transferase
VEETEMDKLIVHTIAGAWGLPSVSPFCLKLETYLQLAGCPFETVVDATPFKAPKRKLPYIEHRGEVIGDSGFIIDYLKRQFGHDLDRSLTPDARATAHAFRRLLEENLYWTLVYDRWFVKENWPLTKRVLFSKVPAPVQPAVSLLARRGVWNELVGHGIGRHTVGEIHEIGIRDVNAVADFLADKPYFMGSEPTEIDAGVYGLLANILEAPIETPIKAAGRARTNLLKYCTRMRTRCFGGVSAQSAPTGAVHAEGPGV